MTAHYFTPRPEGHRVIAAELVLNILKVRGRIFFFPKELGATSKF
jgi:hypothetical protein